MSPASTSFQLTWYRLQLDSIVCEMQQATFLSVLLVLHTALAATFTQRFTHAQKVRHMEARLRRLVSASCKLVEWSCRLAKTPPHTRYVVLTMHSVVEFCRTSFMHDRGMTSASGLCLTMPDCLKTQKLEWTHDARLGFANAYAIKC